MLIITVTPIHIIIHTHIRIIPITILIAVIGGNANGDGGTLFLDR